MQKGNETRSSRKYKTGLLSRAPSINLLSLVIRSQVSEYLSVCVSYFAIDYLIYSGPLRTITALAYGHNCTGSPGSEASPLETKSTKFLSNERVVGGNESRKLHQFECTPTVSSLTSLLGIWLYKFNEDATQLVLWNCNYIICHQFYTVSWPEDLISRNSKKKTHGFGINPDQRSKSR